MSHTINLRFPSNRNVLHISCHISSINWGYPKYISLMYEDIDLANKYKVFYTSTFGGYVEIITGDNYGEAILLFEVIMLRRNITVLSINKVENF